ncbi:MAG: hypothetical protein K6A90_14515 [Lachnospiraceae bacterium]|nr:hypothetical protein [Lachnospiraceae bacterium]
MRFNKISAVMNSNLHKKKAIEKTIKQYRTACKAFAAFVKDCEGTERIPKERYRDLVQTYFEKLKSEGKSPDTVHTYAAGITQGLRLSIKDFVIDRRTRPHKGRKPINRNEAYIPELGKHLGIRRDEFGQLKGGSLIEKDGCLFVIVRKGKGGKYQEQLILPSHEEAVKAAFKGKGADEFIYDKEELKAFKDANTHAMRRQIAREAYAYYLSLFPEDRAHYMEIAHKRFLENAEKGEKMWKKEMDLIRRKPIRYNRGANKTELIRQGREPFFDRECVLLVSVLHLSHYREDVTVDNYLI